MSNEYFTDRELGPKPRIEEEIQLGAWGGIVSIIHTLIRNGSFSSAFPSIATYETDEQSMALAIKAEIPNLTKSRKEPSDWEDEDEVEIIEIDYWPLSPAQEPATITILDLIEFCHRHVAKPVWNLDDYGEKHLTFIKKDGQSEFRESINIVFSRNGLAYELQEDGRIIRLPNTVLYNMLKVAQFQTGDTELDSMLTSARTKYLTPDIDVRRESLEKLWDAWERIKTVLPGKDKKSSAEKLLKKAAQEELFRQMLHKEADQLTDIGNQFQIRHSETNKIPVKINEHIDYLFHRLFALINLFLVVIKK